MSTGEAHLEWTPEREEDEYTLVHAIRHGHRATEKKEPKPDPAATPPPRPAPRHWTLYQQLAHVKPVRNPVAILGSLGVCIYVPAGRHWLISYSPLHLT